MPIEGAILPDDPEALRALIAAQAAELVAARAGLVAKALEIETLKLQIARLRRCERCAPLDPEILALSLTYVAHHEPVIGPSRNRISWFFNKAWRLYRYGLINERIDLAHYP